MGVTVTDNTASIALTTTQRASVALRLMTDAIVEQSTPVTPKDIGDLRKQVLKQVLGLHGEIQWRSDHAVYQEAGVTHGTTMTHYTTPGTGPHFAENAVTAVAEASGSYFQQAGLT